MSDHPSIAGYVSGLYTDLRGRLVFYAAFETGGGVMVAALASDGPMRVVGDSMFLSEVGLAEVEPVGTLVAKIIVETDLKPSGPSKQRASALAARSLGFVVSTGGPEVLPRELRCERWEAFKARAGGGVFAAWAVSVLSLAHDEAPGSPVLATIDRVVSRWPGAARVLRDRVEILPLEVVQAGDDELAEALVDHLLVPDAPAFWRRDRAVAFVRSMEGVIADLDLADMVDLAGRLSEQFHPQGLPDLHGFDGAAALLREMRRRHLAPADVSFMFASFAQDWTMSPPRAVPAPCSGQQETAEDACDLIQEHVAAMTRRFGVPAWLEFAVPDFGEMPARTADSLVLSVVLAIGELDGSAGAPLAEIFLKDLDLVRLLRALRISRTNSSPPAGATHVAEVERNFRDAESAGEFAGRVALRLRAGGARMIGLELADSGFGRDLDLEGIRRGVGVGEVPAAGRRRLHAETYIVPPMHGASAPRRRAPSIRAAHIAGSIVAGMALAAVVVGLTEPQDAPAPAQTLQASVQTRISERARPNHLQVSDLIERRADMIRKAKLNPSPCPGDDVSDRICGRFGDLTLVVTERGTVRPAIAGYVVEGRHPAEVFAWNAGAFRNPSEAWTRHLLQALDDEDRRAPAGMEANALGGGGP